MNGLEKIIARIKSDTEEANAEMLAAAQAQADEILESARAQAAAESEAALNEAGEQCRAMTAIAQSAAEAAIKRAVLSAKGELIDEATQRAVAKMKSLPAEEHFTLLTTLLHNCGGEGGTIAMSEADAARCRSPSKTSCRPEKLLSNPENP